MSTANTAFYRRHPPEDHFRTSVDSAPLMGQAMVVLLAHLDAELNRPARLDMVDIGAGSGQLLASVLDAAATTHPDLARRLRPLGIDLRPRPLNLHPHIEWRVGPAPQNLPNALGGLIIAHEWLDDLPINVYVKRTDNTWRSVVVDPTSGQEHEAVVDIDDPGVAWIQRWHAEHLMPGTHQRFESGHLRDIAWAHVVRQCAKGIVVGIDYAVDEQSESPQPTLVGFRDGHPCGAVPNGSMNITAHVHLTACAAAALESGANCTQATAHGVVDQATALHTLAGVDQRHAASVDPWDALATRAQRNELTDTQGLGRHKWLAHGIGVSLPQPWR